MLPTLGGQTALNAAVALHDSGILRRYNVELIGANIDAIRAGEDRERFKEIVTGLGAEVPTSYICHDIDECLAAVAGTGTARAAGTRPGGAAGRRAAGRGPAAGGQDLATPWW